MALSRQSSQVQTDRDGRICWVCLASEEDDRSANWIRPCRCRGSAKWVHLSCLQRWIDEKQRGDTLATVSCTQCRTDYVILYPPCGSLFVLLEQTDKLINRVCPVATAGVLLLSVYWSAVTYGAVTVMQILGYEEAMSAMQESDHLFLLVGLPTIPIALIFGKMIRWENHTAELLYRICAALSGSHSEEAESPNDLNRAAVWPVNPQPEVAPVVREQLSATRILVGALILPTVATICGKILFGSVIQSPVKRALLGGAVFLAAKGVLRVYYRHQQLVNRTKRFIKSFPDEAEVGAQTDPVEELLVP